MGDRRIVMEVRIQWVSSDDDDVLRGVFQALDENGVNSPVDYVANAMRSGAAFIDYERFGIDGSLELRVDGPDRWGIAYERPEG